MVTGKKKHNDIVFEDKNIPDSFITNAAIVRVWTSIANLSHQAPCKTVEDSPGHVSLELIVQQEPLVYCRGTFDNDTYISVGYDPPLPLPTVTSIHPHHFVNSYHDDLSVENEGREPEYTFVFYSLDVDAMVKAVKRMKIPRTLNRIKWTLMTRPWSLSSLTSEDVNSNSGDKDIYVNCTSLVLEILSAGGLRSLFDITDEISASGLASGDASRVVSKESNKENLKSSLLYITEMIGSRFIANPDATAKLMMFAKRKDMKKVESQRLPTYGRITFTNNDADMLDWDTINRLPAEMLDSIKELLKTERTNQKIPRKQCAKTTEWLPETNHQAKGQIWLSSFATIFAMVIAFIYYRLYCQ